MNLFIHFFQNAVYIEKYIWRVRSEKARILVKIGFYDGRLWMIGFLLSNSYRCRKF